MILIATAIIQFMIVQKMENNGGDVANIIFSTLINGYGKPLNSVLDMKIKYITTHNNILIIEAIKSRF